MTHHISSDMNTHDRDHSVVSTETIGTLITPLADGSSAQTYEKGPGLAQALEAADERPLVVLSTRESIKRALENPALAALLRGHVEDDKDHAGSTKLIGDVVTVAQPVGEKKARRIHFVGMDADKVKRDRASRFRSTGAQVGPLLYAEGNEAGGAVVVPEELLADRDFVAGLAQGVGNSTATPTKKVVADLNKPEPGKVVQLRRRLEAIQLMSDVAATGEATDIKLDQALDHAKGGERLARGKAVARLLSELPANVVTTYAFVRTAQKLVEALNARFGNKLQMEISGPEGDKLNTGTSTVTNLKMGLLTAIHQGSTMPGPYYVRIKYRPGVSVAEGAKRKVNRVVAKTMIFDDGGRGNKIEHAKGMKSDMSAGANSLGTLVTMLEAGIQKDIDFCFVVCANENGENARRFDDLMRAASGKTVEEGHTDAEGREALADGVAVSRKQIVDEGDEAGEILTVATLTGHAVNTSAHRTPILGYDPEKAHRLAQEIGATGERGESLAVDEVDTESMKGGIADFVNLSPLKPKRGAQTGLAFIHAAGGTPESEIDGALHADIANACGKEKGHPNDLKDHELASGEGIGIVLTWAEKVAA